MKKRIIILGGPTASGKSALAVTLAQKTAVVIINADSQQVYREIPIITAQPDITEQQAVPHALYGIISVQEEFSVAIWLNLVEQEIYKAWQNGKTPILVGGTGMYIKALCNGIATIPEINPLIRQNIRNLCNEKGSVHIHQLLAQNDHIMAAKLNPGDRQRVLRAYEVLLATGKSLDYWQKQPTNQPFTSNLLQIYFLLPDRQQIYKNCDSRLKQMLKKGLLDEISALNNMQVPPTHAATRAHGIREFTAYLNKKISLEEAILQTELSTRHYVKRQFTWFKHQMPEALVFSDEKEINI